MALLESIADKFGFQLKGPKPNTKLKSFTLSRDDIADGVTSDMTNGGGVVVDMEQARVPENEKELISSYRSMALSSEIDEALQEIRNEIFILDIPGERAFELAFTEESGAPPKSIQKKVIEEFRELYEMVDFRNKGMQYFDDWYIDSKLYLYKVVDESNLKDGIQGVIRVDPMKIRLVRIIPQPDQDGLIDIDAIKEVYVYNEDYTSESAPNDRIVEIRAGASISGLQISKDAMCYVNSGVFDRESKTYIGYLNKAIIPFNNLKMMEQAMVIFRVVRAPIRRAFYVGVGGMQKNKAEAYMKKLMAQFRNRMTYDSKTGALSSRYNVQSMIEDYWLPRRDDNKTTEIQTLEGQDASNILEEVNYFRSKLYRALNVPISRFSDQPQSFVFGKGIEIQRDEYRFKKYLDRLRQNFMRLWEDLLKTQLQLKHIIDDEDEWSEMRRYIFWNYSEDNSFVEYKESELINNRVQMLSEVEPYIGKYFSRDWVRRKILRQSDDEINAEKQAIADNPEDNQTGSDQLLTNMKRQNQLASAFKTQYTEDHTQ